MMQEISSEPGSPSSGYAQQGRDSFMSVDALVAAGHVHCDEAEALRALERRYRLRVPRYYANLFDPALGAQCPIRLQALPGLGEQDPVLPAWAQALSQKAFGCTVPWRADAIGDLAKLAAPRLTHRYQHRAILHLSSACAMYCRFCFRKTHLNDAERPLYRGGLGPAFAYLQQHTEIRELILTGGDPLSVGDGRLDEVFAAVRGMPHVRTVRFHSRMTATLPARITDALCQRLAEQPFAVVLVSHFNHPRELTCEALASLANLRRAQVTLLNQSVLLRRVNDCTDTLFELFQTLYEQGVVPYYLHHPDWTDGTFHFRLPIAGGQALMRALSGRLAGPACPRYMLDLPGGCGKVQLLGEQVVLLGQQRGDGLGGALYQMAPPHTRQPGTQQPMLYADMWLE